MLYNKVLKTIKQYKGNKIDEKLLRDVFHEVDYLEYHNVMTQLMEDKIIKPIISSGPNGMYPPLYKRYTILKEEISYHYLMDEIRLLDTSFNIEGYLTQLSKYAEHKDYILAIDNFIKTRNEDLKTQVSINERSFQIFQLEKALKENKTIKSIFTYNTNLEERLNFYNTPEPFFTYDISPYDKEVNILIIENKDTWYTLRKLFSSKENNLFGIYFHILLYGEGKKITRVSSSLTDFHRTVLNGKKSVYYYFGDLDYEGINIFENLIESNRELNIKLMTPLYIEMLQLSKGFELPTTKDLQKEKDISKFLSYFYKQHMDYIKFILGNRRYIPQEIISYIEFSRLVKAGE